MSIKIRIHILAVGMMLWIIYQLLQYWWCIRYVTL